MAAKSPSDKRVPATPPFPTDPLTVGGIAPDFTLPGDSGQSIRLGDFAGQKLVIFFYPRANTTGCTLEATDFTRMAKDFSKAGTAILGVSADPLAAQQRFRDKHKLQVLIASDEVGDMVRAYGAWGTKSMYGKTFEGVLRSTVLIDGKGRIARIWRRVKVPGHAAEVLAAAQEI